MNILIIGSGGREHAFAWKLKQSPRLENLYIAPGNAGTASLGVNLAIGVSDFPSIKKAVLNYAIDMVVVGPEVPLVEGIVDFFEADEQLKNIAVIGPSMTGAKLEGSKEFAKSFMQRHAIPTAGYFTVHAGNLNEGIAYLQSLQAPYVLKADGLAAGKGVLILDDLNEAISSLKEMLGGMFGDASSTVVIEEFLSGVECSVFVLTDGEHYKILPEAKDYKRIGDGDTGLNTGGMGAVSPVPFATQEFLQKVEERIVKPTISGLHQDEIRYRGFIFLGLMNCGGEPFVIEYNVRMGDPETEVVLPRICSDLTELFDGVSNGNLHQKELIVSGETAVTVVVAASGYPGSYKKGCEIRFPGPIAGSVIFHAGTQLAGETVKAAGGRVLAVTSTGKSISEAREISYKTIENIDFADGCFRSDIGMDLLTLSGN